MGTEFPVAGGIHGEARPGPVLIQQPRRGLARLPACALALLPLCPSLVPRRSLPAPHLAGLWETGAAWKPTALAQSMMLPVSRPMGTRWRPRPPLFTQSFLPGGIRRERGAAAECTQLAQLQPGPDGHTPAHGSAYTPRCSLRHGVQPPEPGSRSSASACSRLTDYHFSLPWESGLRDPKSQNMT